MEYLPVLIIFTLFLVNAFSFKINVIEKRLLFFTNIFLTSVLFAVFMKSTEVVKFALFKINGDFTGYPALVTVCALISFCTIDFKSFEGSRNSLLISFYTFLNLALLTFSEIQHLVVFGAFLTLTDSICVSGNKQVLKKTMRDFMLRGLLITIVSLLGLLMYKVSTVGSTSAELTINNHKLFAVSIAIFFLFLVLKVAPAPFHFIFYKTNSLSRPSTVFLTTLLSRVVFVPLLILKIFELIQQLEPDLQAACIKLFLIFILASTTLIYLKLVRLRNSIRVVNYLFLFNSHIIYFSLLFVDETSIRELQSIFLSLITPFLTLNLVESLIASSDEYVDRIKGLLLQAPFLGVIYLVSLFFLWGFPLSLVYDYKISFYSSSFWTINPYILMLLMFQSFSIGFSALRTTVNCSTPNDSKLSFNESVPLKVSCLLLFVLNIFLNFYSWYDLS